MNKLAYAEEICKQVTKLKDLDTQALMCIVDAIRNRQATRLLLWDSEELEYTLRFFERIQAL